MKRAGFLRKIAMEMHKCKRLNMGIVRFMFSWEEICRCFAGDKTCMNCKGKKRRKGTYF